MTFKISKLIPVFLRIQTRSRFTGRLQERPVSVCI